MQRKRYLKFTPLTRIRIKIGTHKDGTVHFLFGAYGKEACPTQYDENGRYIKGQPFYCWISGTAYYPDYNEGQNKELRYHLWKYLRVNIKHIHPLDLAK